MKILYVTKQYVRGVNCERYVARGLEANGCEVTFHENMHSCPQFGPDDFDLILFSKNDPDYTPNLISQCQEWNIPTVTWNFDLYFDYPLRDHVRLKNFRSDILFTTDGGHQPQYEENGYNHHMLSAGIDEEEAVEYDRNYQYSVAFVGSLYYSHRRHLNRFLSDTYGNQYVPIHNKHELKLNEALAQVKIVVGDSYPTPNGHYWSNRIYEILGRGGFILHPEIPGLEKEFTDTVHYASFDREGGFFHLQNMIDHYLTHDSKREAIRKAGHKLVKEKYTYRERCKTLLRKVEQLRVRVSA